MSDFVIPLWLFVALCALILLGLWDVAQMITKLFEGRHENS